MKEKVPCPGCKALFKDIDGPVGPYGVSSAGCWEVFTHLLGYEHDTLNFPEENRLIVDAYSVQHPQNFELQKKLGISERHQDAAVQSVAGHLIALYCALEKKIPLKTISKILDHFLSRGATFEALEPPDNLGAITVADFSPTFTYDEYQQFAWQWAREAWHAWEKDHKKIKEWYAIYVAQSF